MVWWWCSHWHLAEYLPTAVREYFLLMVADFLYRYREKVRTHPTTTLTPQQPMMTWHRLSVLCGGAGAGSSSTTQGHGGGAVGRAHARRRAGGGW